MKFLKWFFAALGLVALAVGGYFFFRSWMDVKTMMAAVNVNHAGYTSPWNVIAIATGLGTLGGLLLGMALGLPSRLAGSIRKEALAQATLEGSREGLHQERVVVERDAR